MAMSRSDTAWPTIPVSIAAPLERSEDCCGIADLRFCPLAADQAATIRYSKRLRAELH
jgi:hypothetical protein